METGKITILVADDDPTLLNLLALILHTAGFEVLTARDGLDALAVARTHPGRIELLLSDVMMPGLDGPQLARQLKLAHPTMRVVIMSGYVRDPSALDSGWQFVQKPFRPNELLSTIRAVLTAPMVKAAGQGQ